MTYFTEGIRLLLDQRKTRQAADLLTSILENGNAEVLQQALTITEKAQMVKAGENEPSKPKGRISSSSLKSFIDQLEKDQIPLIEFLTHFDVAEKHLKAKAWKEAKPHLKRALELHQDAFKLPKKKLHAKLHKCEEAISFNYFKEKGNDFFQLGSWQNALANYKKSLGHQLDEFEAEISSIKERIVICGLGIRFEQFIDQGQGLYNQKRWTDATVFYEKALNLYQDEFSPDKKTLIGIIEECRTNAAEKESQKKFLGIPLTMNKTINAVLALGIIAVAIFFLLPEDSISTPAKQELNPIAVGDTISEDKKSTETLSPEVEVEAMALPADSVEQVAANTDSTLKIVSDTLDGGQSFAIKEPEEIQMPLSEIIDNAGASIADSATKTPTLDTLSSEIAPFEPGRVAVIPFCNGTEDQDFAKKLYMDASYAIRKNNTGNFTSVSKNSVRGAIQRLGYQSDNFCSEIQAIKVAQSLKVESVVVGNIIQLPDSQYRIICEVLHIPSRQYSREITLTDGDLERLRRNLRQEIQQIFY